MWSRSGTLHLYASFSFFFFFLVEGVAYPTHSTDIRSLLKPLCDHGWTQLSFTRVVPEGDVFTRFADLGPT